MADKTTKVRIRQYEGMFLFGSNAASELNNAIATARGMIEKHGGEILVIKKWDERKLTFEMNKQKRGVYIIAYFKAPTSAIAPIDREVRLSEEVLRALFTDAEHLTLAEMEAVEPQPIIKAEPPAWDRGFGEGGGGGRGGFGGDRGGDRGDRAPRPRKDEPAEAGAAKD
ncbi:30S ribosomal protein S6 [Humisphaera borealis]|uniref:Small ribosomal subunit protein bS6 n=1 Tax=Humisphaera borealis TaxID=2807512 RepID=A0A7M2WR28_9BACT|nr:30S ribosomal protein S6 [Humisphaera borealis]QOV87859.1 30S ribosomal protein S6 [Humisphaera borealis]